MLQVTVSALVASVLFCGCAQQSASKEATGSKVATIQMEGNPTTGYTWQKNIEPEDVVKISEKAESMGKPGMVGAPSMFTYEFEGLKEGEATVTFSYARSWEKDVPPIKTRTFRVKIDKDLNVTLSE